MNKFSSIFIILALFIFIGCDREDCTAIDGNMWSSRSLTMMGSGEADNYCKNLNECGYSDWRLPNINELRTLIQNCPATQPDGICGVHDPDCLKDPDCFYYSAGQCLCEKKEDNGGYYSKLGDDDNVVLWSSSDFEYISGCEATTLVWLVDFSSGEVRNEEYGYHNVRCVR